jgi:hypothetical protein
MGEAEGAVIERLSRARRTVTMQGTALRAGLPRYVLDVAAARGLDLSDHTWAAVVPGGYEAQKVLLFSFPAGAAEPALVAKVARSERSSARLERASAALTELQRWPGLAGAVAPLRFAGRHAGLAVVGEGIVCGTPFRERTTGTAGCPHATAAVDWITSLGVASAHPVDGPSTVSVMTTLVDRLTAVGGLSPDHLEFLRELVGRLATAGAPAVFVHGDAGTWNLLASREGVAVLDWENADPEGPPLWDLLYFLRSYASLSGRVTGASDRRWAGAAPFLSSTALTGFVSSSLQRYRREVGLPSEAVEPLFHLCWALHAVKEAARLRPEDRGRGAQLAFLRTMLDHRANPVLTSLLRDSAP